MDASPNSLKFCKGKRSSFIKINRSCDWCLFHLGIVSRMVRSVFMIFCSISQFVQYGDALRWQICEQKSFKPIINVTTFQCIFMLTRRSKLIRLSSLYTMNGISLDMAVFSPILNCAPRSLPNASPHEYLKCVEQQLKIPAEINGNRTIVQTRLIED